MSTVPKGVPGLGAPDSGAPGRGVPATDLDDADLAQQGNQAHATRNWVFLHGTAEQFRRHTERMLELEQEYLRRHPKRTWQGSGGAAGDADLAQLDTLAQIRHLTRTYAAAMEGLLGRGAVGTPVPDTKASDPQSLIVDLLRRYDAAGGRMHKLEAHQAAREIGVPPAAVAMLFKGATAVLEADGEYRALTRAGRAALVSTGPAV
ncbi:MAG: DUF6158 family protein [Sporichthyaceae bacterium]